MKQPVFYLSNRNRRDDFAIETFSLDGKSFIKRSLTKASTQHIERMLDTYGLLKPIKLGTIVVRPERIDEGAVKFPRIDGRNAENMLVETLVSEGPDIAISLLENLSDIIKALPTAQVNPTSSRNFQKIFNGTYDRRMDCTTIGLVDLNFDNFIIDPAGGWNLIDYEWCFDFAVPKDFLMQRMLFWFFVIRFQKLLLLHSAKYSMVRLAENIYVPAQIYRKYEKHFNNLEELTRAEAGFQRHVHNISPKSTMFDFRFSTPRAGTPDELSSARRNLSLLGRHQLMQEQFDIALRVNKELENHIDQIKGSKSYKLTRAMQKASSKLRPKKK